MDGHTPDTTATLSYVAAETSARRTTFTYIKKTPKKCLQQLFYTNTQVMHASARGRVITRGKPSKYCSPG